MLGAYRIVRSTGLGVQNVEKQFQIAGIRKHGTSFAVCLFSVANVALPVQKWWIQCGLGFAALVLRLALVVGR